MTCSTSGGRKIRLALTRTLGALEDVGGRKIRLAIQSAQTVIKAKPYSKDVLCGTPRGMWKSLTPCPLQIYPSKVLPKTSAESKVLPAPGALESKVLPGTSAESKVLPREQSAPSVGPQMPIASGGYQRSELEIVQNV